MHISPFWKTVVAVIGAAVVAVEAALVGGDQLISSQEWVSIGLAVLVALGVYVVPNRP